MSVPGRVESAVLLLALEPPAWFLRHSRAVAEIAAWLACRMADRAFPIDRGLVEAAALLHDIDKLLPAHDPARQLPHGEGSGAWLADHGHPELAPLVAAHPVTRLVDGRFADELTHAGSPEARVVAYADKRAGQRLESLEARFGSWERRYPPTGNPEERARHIAAGVSMREAARALERAVCTAAGVEPNAVRRLRWTERAFADARDSLGRSRPNLALAGRAQ